MQWNVVQCFILVSILPHTFVQKLPRNVTSQSNTIERGDVKLTHTFEKIKLVASWSLMVFLNLCWDTSFLNHPKLQTNHHGLIWSLENLQWNQYKFFPKVYCALIMEWTTKVIYSLAYSCYKEHILECSWDFLLHIRPMYIWRFTIVLPTPKCLVIT